MSTVNIVLFNQVPDSLSAFVVPEDVISTQELKLINDKFVNGDDLTDEQHAVFEKVYTLGDVPGVIKLKFPAEVEQCGIVNIYYCGFIL